MVEKQIPQLYLAQLSDVSAIERKRCSKCCTCKNCGNEYGQRPIPSGRRQRKSYDEQKHPTRGKPSREFLLDMGEESVIGRFSLFEVLLLKS